MAYFLERGHTVTIAVDIPMSNLLCNLAWERGLIVEKNLLDYRGDMLDTFLGYVRREEVTHVFAEDLKILGSYYTKIAENLVEIRRHNIKIVFPEWELDPMKSDFEAVIGAMKDFARHDSLVKSRMSKTGLKEKKSFICPDPPRKRKLPMREIAELRVKNLGWATIAKQLNIPRMTIMDRRPDIEEFMEKNGYFNRRRK